MPASQSQFKVLLIFIFQHLKLIISSIFLSLFGDAVETAVLLTIIIF